MQLGPKKLVSREVVRENRLTGQQRVVNGELQTKGDTVSVYAVKQCELRDELEQTLQLTFSQERTIQPVDPRPWLLIAAAAGASIPA